MEFRRFGSIISGEYWGCCAICIIQNFNTDPDAKASIQLVSGDSGTALTNGKGSVFVGPTYRDIFKNRIRIGTFSTQDMPNHIFLASLTGEQCKSAVGKKWLAILKEEGFEFIRATDNSVYSGPSLSGTGYRDPVYLFGLFRNIGKAAVKDPFAPPKAWSDLPDPYGEELTPERLMVQNSVNMVQHMTAVQTERWKAGKTVFMSEAELIEAGAPVILSGKIGEKSKIKAVNKTSTTKSLTGGETPSPVACEPVAPTPA